MIFFAQFMHRLHQDGSVIRVGELRNSVSEVEHMAATVTVAAQDLFHLVVDDFGCGKQHVRVQVALQRLGHILGEARYLQSAERSLQAFDNVINKNPAGCASLT